MSTYFQDIFYRTIERETPELLEKICRDAYSKCHNWWVDDHPNGTRRKIDMTIEEILKYLYTHKIHFTIIHRRGYEDWNNDSCFDKWHLEIGFCTLNKKDPNGDLFLWIELDASFIPYFIQKYGLKQI
jgi:hypothetical protein